MSDGRTSFYGCKDIVQENNSMHSYHSILQWGGLWKVPAPSPLLTDWKSEVQRGQVTCQKLHSWLVRSLPLRHHAGPIQEATCFGGWGKRRGRLDYQ